MGKLWEKAHRLLLHFSDEERTRAQVTRNRINVSELPAVDVRECSSK